MQLPADKKRRVDGQSGDEPVGGRAARAIPRRHPGSARPVLSSAQERLWFLDRLEPGTPTYNIPRLYALTGPLDVTSLARSVDEIVARHEVLRTVVIEEAGRPVPRVGKSMQGIVRLETVEGADPRERDRVAWARAEEEARLPFDLSTGPLIRVLLLRKGPEDHLLLITMHHIVSDGWSLGVFVRELGELYAVGTSSRATVLPRLPIQYSDYADWQHERFQGEYLERHVRYWKEELGGELPVLDLGTDHLRPAARRSVGGTYRFSLPRDATETLKDLGRREGCTLFMTLLSAYGVLLHRYSSQEELIIGTPIAGRTRLETEGLVGLFVNSLAIRLNCEGDPPFRDLLKQVRRKSLGAYEHQDVPFEKLVEELQPRRTLSRTPVFQTMFVLQNTPSLPLHLVGLDVEKKDIDTGSAKFDITLSITERDDRTDGHLEFDSDLFDPSTARRIAEHYRMLLQGIIDDPGRQISALPMLTPPERHEVLEKWNATETPDPSPACIHELIESQAARSPDKTALVWENERVSYRALNERANRLANILQKCGVGPEVPVGVCMERSAEMIAAMLAILKVGGAYVPLDPSYPPDRITFMVDDARTPVVIMQDRVTRRFPALANRNDVRILRVDADQAMIGEANAANLPLRYQDSSLAYVIYTSGSTGTPKGVAIEHRNVTALIGWAGGLYNAEDLEGVLASTSICFDLSIFEIFVPLCLGGTVLLSENVLQLPTLGSRGDVRLLNTVPSAITELLRIDGIPRSVRTINLAGEPLAQSLVRQLYALGSVKRVYDLYGPTEDTTYSTCALRTPEGPQTIGRPLPNKRVYILDQHCEPVPVGITGEIYIGGRGVTRGYLRRPELTAQSFLVDPFVSDRAERMYRTGDLGRFQSDGSIQFLGRRDNQVKIRGFRIELGEIEAGIASNPSVRDAAVVLREDLPGMRRIVAYVVLRDGGSEVSGIRDFIKASLPDYMIPSAFVALESFPLLPNGKVDRNALPPPEEGAEARRIGASDAPKSQVEKAIAQIWAALLGVKEVGIRENFFDLGGHSLLATQVISRIRDALHCDLPLITMFETPTVEELASIVEAVVLKEVDRPGEKEDDTQKL